MTYFNNNTINEFFFKGLNLLKVEDRSFNICFHLRTQERKTICPSCFGTHIHINNSKKFSYFSDTTFIGKTSLLKINYNQYECQDCGAVFNDNIPLPLCNNHRITCRLHEYVTDLLSFGLTISQVAKASGLDWKTVKDIDKKNLMNKYIENGKIKIPEEPSEFIGVDEFLLHHPLKYATIVMDLISGHVLWIGYGKSVETLHEFFKLAGEKWKKGIKAVTMDMNAPYAKCIEEYTNAEVVYDHFHLIQLLNEKINKIRIQYIKLYENAGKTDEANDLKKGKYILLSSSKHIEEKDKKNEEFNRELKSKTDDQYMFNKPTPKTKKKWKEIKEKLLKKNSIFITADMIKEKINKAYTLPQKEMANEINECIHLCKSAHNSYLSQFGRTLESRFTGIVNFAKYKISSGKVEGTNRMLKTIRRTAYGFADDEYFFLKVIDHSRRKKPKSD